MLTGRSFAGIIKAVRMGSAASVFWKVSLLYCFVSEVYMTVF